MDSDTNLAEGTDGVPCCQPWILGDGQGLDAPDHVCAEVADDSVTQLRGWLGIDDGSMPSIAWLGYPFPVGRAAIRQRLQQSSALLENGDPAPEHVEEVSQIIARALPTLSGIPNAHVALAIHRGFERPDADLWLLGVCYFEESSDSVGDILLWEDGPAPILRFTDPFVRFAGELRHDAWKEAVALASWYRKWVLGTPVTGKLTQRGRPPGSGKFNGVDDLLERVGSALGKLGPEATGLDVAKHLGVHYRTLQRWQKLTSYTSMNELCGAAWERARSQ